MAHLVADSGANKGQFGTLVEQRNGDLRTHDYEVLEKLASFNKRIKTISANKEKPERPDTPPIAIRELRLCQLYYRTQK